MHAETLDGMLNRLTSPPMNIPPHMIPTLNFVLHISRLRIEGGIVRRVIKVWEVRNADDFAEIAVWNPTSDTFTHRLWDSRTLLLVAEQIGVSPEEALREIMRRKRLLDYLSEQGIVEYNEIAKWIYAYYADPEATLEKAKVPVETEKREKIEVKQPPIVAKKKVLRDDIQSRLISGLKHIKREDLRKKIIERVIEKGETE